MTEPPPPQLDYAGQAPWHRGRGFRRSIVLAAALLIALSLWRFAPDAFHQAQRSHWYRQATTFSVPAGTIAFTNNAQDLKKCQAMGTAYRNGGLVVAPWEELSGNTMPIVFCHERDTPSGEKILVVVTAADRSKSEFASVILYPVLFSTGGIERIVTDFESKSIAGDSVTIYMGVPDPADPTHFTIDIDRGGTRATLDGYVKYRDFVVLEERK